MGYCRRSKFWQSYFQFLVKSQPNNESNPNLLAGGFGGFGGFGGGGRGVFGGFNFGVPPIGAVVDNAFNTLGANI